MRRIIISKISKLRRQFRLGLVNCKYIVKKDDDRPANLCQLGMNYLFENKMESGSHTSTVCYKQGYRLTTALV